MKRFFDWLKDFVYDSTDYIIMLLIIVSVVFVIGWRLDVLFADDATDIPSKNIIIADNKIPPVEDEPTEDIESNLDDDDLETPIIENPVVNPDSKSVSVTIPPGSLPSKIGSILETNGLVTSKNDFVKKTQELNLDKKLKSGSFNIPTKSSIEEILKIITK